MILAFGDKYCQYVENVNDKRAYIQIRALLNVILHVVLKIRKRLKNRYVCVFKKAYYNLDNKVNDI